MTEDTEDTKDNRPRKVKRRRSEDIAGNHAGKKVKGPSHQCVSSTLTSLQGHSSLSDAIHRDLRKHPIAIRVGQDEDSETFHCFIDLLRGSSCFFYDQLSEPEATTPQPKSLTRLDLPGEVPAVFAKYCEWLDKDRLWSTAEELRDLIPYNLARLFCLGERIQAYKFKNAVVDALHAKSRLTIRQIISNNDQSTKQVDGVFETYYRAARWVSTNVEVKASLYVYFVDFFAYFVLQTVRSLNHTVLGGLATEFLWQVQNTVTAALQRLVPDGPPPLLPHNPAATTPTIITIDDSPTDIAGDDAPAVSTPTPPQLPATAVSARPKAELVQTILVSSATLRMLSTAAQQMQEKAAEKKGKGKQKGNGGGSSSVFGIDNLCKYHIHTRHTKAAECAEAFVRRTGGKGVWVCGLVMRDVGK